MHKTLLLTFVAAVIPAIIVGYPIFQCDGGHPTPRALRIQGCDSSPCSVTRGSVIPFEADLTANANSATLRMVVDVTALGETTVYPLPEVLANVCNWLSVGGCPVSVGQLITQAAAIPVIFDFSGGIPIVLRSRIYNADNTTLSCSIINARI